MSENIRIKTTCQTVQGSAGTLILIPSSFVVKRLFVLDDDDPSNLHPPFELQIANHTAPGNIHYIVVLIEIQIRGILYLII